MITAVCVAKRVEVMELRAEEMQSDLDVAAERPFSPGGSWRISLPLKNGCKVRKHVNRVCKVPEEYYYTMKTISDEITQLVACIINLYCRNYSYL
jgi:hypothetical protein